MTTKDTFLLSALYECLKGLREACGERDRASTAHERLNAADRYTEALIAARAVLARAEREVQP